MRNLFQGTHKIYFHHLRYKIDIIYYFGWSIKNAYRNLPAYLLKSPW